MIFVNKSVSPHFGIFQPISVVTKSRGFVACGVGEGGAITLLPQLYTRLYCWTRLYQPSKLPAGESRLELGDIELIQRATRPHNRQVQQGFGFLLFAVCYHLVLYTDLISKVRGDVLHFSVNFWQTGASLGCT